MDIPTIQRICVLNFYSYYMNKAIYQYSFYFLEGYMWQSLCAKQFTKIILLIFNNSISVNTVFFFFKEIHGLLFIYLFIYDCVESSFLCKGFL